MKEMNDEIVCESKLSDSELYREYLRSEAVDFMDFYEFKERFLNYDRMDKCE